MTQKLFTAAEVADLLRTVPVVISRKCRAGEIRATKPHRTWLISAEALQEYLDAHSNQQDVA